jgi:hypothetical protein
MVLDRHHPVPGAGARVRVRLAHASDAALLRELVFALGLEASDMDLRRALRFRIGERWTVCATAWDGAHERLVGFGALEADRERLTLLAGEPAVEDLLRRALDECARTWGRRVA